MAAGHVQLKDAPHELARQFVELDSIQVAMFLEEVTRLAESWPDKGRSHWWDIGSVLRDSIGVGIRDDAATQQAVSMLCDILGGFAKPLRPAVAAEAVESLVMLTDPGEPA